LTPIQPTGSAKMAANGNLFYSINLVS